MYMLNIYACQAPAAAARSGHNPGTWTSSLYGHHPCVFLLAPSPSPALQCRIAVHEPYRVQSPFTNVLGSVTQDATTHFSTILNSAAHSPPPDLVPGTLRASLRRTGPAHPGSRARGGPPSNSGPASALSRGDRRFPIAR